jgi:hypothetical protein
MASGDALPVPRKNTAYRFTFAIRKPSDSTLITSWTGQDSEVSLDGGSFADCTNEATEIGTSGVGYIDLTSAEMNADCVVLKVTVTNSGAVPLVFVLYPEEAGDYRANMVQVGGVAVAIGTATVSTSSTTTSVTTSACSPAGAAADQFKGRVIIFGNSTTTTALRGCAALITASSNSATPTFTLAAALPTSPVSGDTFVIA